MYFVIWKACLRNKTFWCLISLLVNSFCYFVKFKWKSLNSMLKVDIPPKMWQSFFWLIAKIQTSTVRQTQEPLHFMGPLCRETGVWFYLLRIRNEMHRKILSALWFAGIIPVFSSPEWLGFMYCIVTFLFSCHQNYAVNFTKFCMHK